ncbi:MAG: hypothetical protein Q8942_18825, partial [Bacillota bacterium]|nr:hypothetical protein [Bacillota bacterium]
ENINKPNPSNGDVPMKMTYSVRDLDSSGNVVNVRDVQADYYYGDLTGNLDLNGGGIYIQYEKDFGRGGVDNNY